MAMVGGVLPVQLPTGYGKTLTAAAVFAAKRAAGICNRLLYLVPTKSQLEQFCNDGRDDFLDAGLAGVRIRDIGYSPALAVKEHRNGSTLVFVTTIQALATSAAVGMAVRDLMQTGTWMVVADEHHHYGIGRTWGRVILDLPSTFTLAMSATPNRKDNDGAFGDPKVVVTYREAVKQGAVKRLRLHSYEYRVDAIAVNGEVISFTTSEIANGAGSDDPAAIDKYIADRKLRWSPKYISPLVSIPLERLLNRKSGGVRAQAIVGAMSCLHAEMVCDQIKTMFADLLSVDWVGTGPNGRTDAENQEIIAKFCPPKVGGKRRPQDVKLDVLVHVGMAGEGLDSVYVSEVVHLNRASITNQNDQENGRAARRIPDAPEDLQVAYINVDSASEYARWKGPEIELVFDRVNGEVPESDEDCEADPQERETGELPEEPTIMIADCALEHIDKGDAEVKACAVAIAKAINERQPFDMAVLDDINHPIYDRAIELRRRELEDRARGLDQKSTLMQLRESINSAVGACASLAARTGSASIGRFERSLIGDMKRRINGQMKRRWGHGIGDADEAELRERYAWLRDLSREVTSTKELPPWLR